MDLTIVIATRSVSALKECVTQLRKQTGPDVEIVVVRKGEDLSIFAARRAGMGRADTARVACLDERYIVTRDWSRAIAECSVEDVVSGPVLPSKTLSAVGWSIYLSEYAHVIHPAADANAQSTPGGNAVYPRSRIQGVAEANELAFHTRLFLDGCRFQRNPLMAAEFASPPDFREYLQERFANSVAWGSGLAAGAGRLRRGLLVFSRLALPALLLWRRGRAVLAARRYRFRFLQALPLLLLYAAIEMAGEITGLLRRPC